MIHKTPAKGNPLPKHTKAIVTASLAAAATVCAAVLAPNVATAATTPTTTTPAAAAPFTSALVDSWTYQQKPSLNGVVQTSSIQTVDAPGDAAGRPAGKVTKFTLNPAARYANGSYIVPRVEQYSRYPVRTNIDPTAWPDPVGSTRWYTFSIYLPADFQTTTTTPWVVLTQWKGLRGGTPPLDIEVHKDYLKMGGSRATGLPNDANIGEIPLGKWTTFNVGMSLSTDASTGWLEVVRDGAVVIPKTSMATMDTVGGTVDPIYFKQGIYQNAAWTKTHVSYASSVLVSATAPDGIQ